MSKIADSKFGKSVSKIWHNRFFGIVWVRLGLYAILLNFIIECLNRLSVVKGITHMFTRPLVFLFNTIMIFFTLCIVPFFKKRIFATSLISAVWLVLGIVNCVISANRKTPFTAPDFFNIGDGLKIIRQYISLPGIVALCVLACAIVLGVIFLAIKSPSVTTKINPLKCGIVLTTTFGILMLYLNIGNATKLLATNFGNIRDAYRQYGFNYCFMSSLINSGIHKPKGYSKDKVQDIIDQLPDDPTTEAPTEEPTGPAENPTEPVTPEVEEDKPNIIFLQLESFFDPTTIIGLDFSEDPIPTMRDLYQNYSSGYLSVPSFGAGTANTEFEVMSGMNLDDFGPGEYPYKTVLRSKACESIGYYLAEYGYRINALHNNDGDFYERNEVFSRLGYDTFTSLEYFKKYDENAIGWCRDINLVDEITGILDATEHQDFIYTISVQGHGEYPDNTDGLWMPVKVSNNEITGNPVGFEFYVNQLHEMDKFVAKLIEILTQRDEKTILVIYGDHLPSIDVEDDNLTNGDIYKTQYVIWDNYGLQKEDKDVQAFQLSSIVLDRVGLLGGVISKYHLTFMDDEDQETYLENLTLLEYDLLYGDCEAYDGKMPYQITNLRMGYKTIAITDVRNISNHVIIEGKNFTKDSIAMVNDEYVTTFFNTENELLLDDFQLNEGDKIVVVQKTASEKILSSTSIYVYR